MELIIYTDINSIKFRSIPNSNNNMNIDTVIINKSLKSAKSIRFKTKLSSPTTQENTSNNNITISLYINETPYQHGILCTFCTQKEAILHCMFCKDFYCKSCDKINHKPLKRKHHTRQKLSKLNLFQAANILIRTFRLNFYLKELQRRARKTFKRFYDRNTFQYYYYNIKYGTSSWRKPYCLRQQELFPLLDSIQAANYIQGLYRMWKAREITRQLILLNYEKIFDRHHSNFYYAYLGKSLLIPKSSWEKPRYCNRRSYMKDIPILYTLDVAALVIQRKWRAISLRELFRLLARNTYEQIFDPIKNCLTYYNKDLGIYLDKLRIMRQQPWNPNDIEKWSMNQVQLFLRRIGLKQYLIQFIDYEVDGKTLLLLDIEDYENMNIYNKIHQKKIFIEINKIYKFDKKKRVTEAMIIKREKFQKIQQLIQSAIIIQKYYRRYYIKKILDIQMTITNVNKKLQDLQNIINKSSIWYTERHDIPSRLYTGDRMLLDKHHLQSKTSTNTSTSSTSSTMNTLPLLPKSFGRKRDHLSVHGWGRRDKNLKWTQVTTLNEFTKTLIQSEKMDNRMSSTSTSLYSSNMNILPAILEEHPTRIFTEKLRISGYDRRREQRFYGVEVDPYDLSLEAKPFVDEMHLL